MGWRRKEDCYKYYECKATLSFHLAFYVRRSPYDLRAVPALLFYNSYIDPYSTLQEQSLGANKQLFADVPWALRKLVKAFQSYFFLVKNIESTKSRIHTASGVSKRPLYLQQWRIAWVACQNNVFSGLDKSSLFSSSLWGKTSKPGPLPCEDRCTPTTNWRRWSAIYTAGHLKETVVCISLSQRFPNCGLWP